MVILCLKKEYSLPVITSYSIHYTKLYEGLEVDPLFRRHFRQIEAVGGSAGQHRGAEILHDHQLFPGVAAGHGDNSYNFV